MFEHRELHVRAHLFFHGLEMPLAKIREERARLLRDDDDAVLPGSPTTRQRAPGGAFSKALSLALYAVGGTLYVMLLYMFLNHQQAIRDVVAPIYTSTRSFLDDHLLRHLGLHASIPEVQFVPDGYFAHGVPQLRNTAPRLASDDRRREEMPARHRRVRRRSHSVPGQPPAVRERAPRAAGRPSRLHRRRVFSYGAVDAKGGEVVRGWG